MDNTKTMQVRDDDMKALKAATHGRLKMGKRKERKKTLNKKNATKSNKTKILKKKIKKIIKKGHKLNGVKLLSY